jgi:hypothetical protein
MSSRIDRLEEAGLEQHGGVLGYKTIDKTDWFIQQMKAGSFSRHEIVAIAAKEFPSIPVKTLNGTIGQYWSDSVNPKWGTYKAIQARGLKVVENAGKRRIVDGAATLKVPTPTNRNSRVTVPSPARPRAFTASSASETRCGRSPLLLSRMAAWYRVFQSFRHG